MLIRACVRSQGKGSYKHKALISSGSYLLNEEKGAKKKALISMQALIKVGSYKHTTTVLFFASVKIIFGHLQGRLHTNYLFDDSIIIRVHERHSCGQILGSGERDEGRKDDELHHHI